MLFCIGSFELKSLISFDSYFGYILNPIHHFFTVYTQCSLNKQKHLTHE